jgi:ABC-type amino acid transport substrate-binding protein
MARGLHAFEGFGPCYDSAAERKARRRGDIAYRTISQEVTMLPRTEHRILCLTILVPLMMLVGWTGPAAAESLFDRIKRIGTFNAGVRADFAPIGSVDDSGNPIGFGPDLAKIFADKMGVKLKYTIVTSASRIPLVLNGGIDADIGLTTPTKQRNEQVDFTTPYIWDSVAMLVKKGASLNLADYAPPKKISIAQGSSIVDYVKEKLPNADLVQFQNPSDGAAALIQGKVDAYASNRYAVRAISQQQPNFVVSNTIALDPIAITVHQDDSKWLNWLNFTMQEMWQKGDYQKLYQKWFGDPPEWQIWSAYRLQPGIGQP